ncbi:MAG TPA: hypothetical protein VJS44_00755 [Pyrinomonadaceae bacterium]|nr:hypothetical protein [Pyrinomonadaceae bacterium]
MKVSKRDTCLFLITLCIAGATATAALRSKNNLLPNQEQQEDINQFPLADSTAPKPTDPKKIAKKKAKSKKYAQYKDNVGPGVVKASAVYHWPPDFPELPVAQSDAVIVGVVSEATAELTEDESSVYSEFTIDINEVLKNDNQGPLSPNTSIIVDRPGGRVKYGTGHISLFWLQGFGMPRKGRQYVLFIKRGGPDEDYQIITGYEIRQGRVWPLDTSTSSDTNFGIYTNSDAVSFLSKIRYAVAKAS